MNTAQFLDCDYISVEARIVCWLAEQEDALQNFRAYDVATTKEVRYNLEPYRIMASQIFGKSVHEINKHPERFVGKECVLGCGFGLGGDRFRVQCKKKGYDLPEGLEFKAVKSWRKKHYKVVKLWSDLEEAAKKAVLQKNTTFKVGQHLSFHCKDIEGLPFLLMRLPSGRKLAYFRPKIVPGKFEGTTAVSFFANIKGTTWGQISVWGGVFAENCLTGDTQVLSKSRGWVKMKSITREDSLWDGIEFVQHQGLVRKGLQKVIDCHGVRCTPDHLFLTGEGWKDAQTACTLSVKDVSSKNEVPFLFKTQGSYESLRSEIRSVTDYKEGAREREKDNLDLSLRLWVGNREDRMRFKERYPCWMLFQMSDHEGISRRQKLYTQHESSPGLCGMEKHAGSLFQSPASSLEELRRKRNNSLRRVAGRLREFLEVDGANLPEWTGHRSRKQRWELLTRKLPLGDSSTQHQKPEEDLEAEGCSSRFLGCSSKEWDQENHPLLSVESGVILGTDNVNSGRCEEQVFDILNCGPRNRFAVKSPSGHILMAHNCTQAVAADIMANGAHNCENNGYEIATLIHDQALAYYKEGQTVERYVELLTDLPNWAAGLPIAAEGSLVPFYLKD